MKYFDTRLGGKINLLVVEHQAGDPGIPSPYRELWVVDYDRFRDEHWTVERCQALMREGRHDETPVLGHFPTLEYVQRKLRDGSDYLDGYRECGPDR